MHVIHFAQTSWAGWLNGKILGEGNRREKHAFHTTYGKKAIDPFRSKHETRGHCGISKPAEWTADTFILFYVYIMLHYSSLSYVILLLYFILYFIFCHIAVSIIRPICLITRSQVQVQYLNTYRNGQHHANTYNYITCVDDYNVPTCIV